MPWVRFADDYLTHDKIMPLSPMARLLDMCGVIYSARELRDGHLSAADVRAVAAMAHVLTPQRWADELVVARRWSVEEGGYAIHDYLDYQPSREHVLAERAAAAERKRLARLKRLNGVRPDSQPESHPESTSEIARSSATPVPVPGPGPVPGNPYGIPAGAPPNPPRKRRGPGSSRRRPNGVTFDEEGPRFEQRTGADGKREWAQVEA